jgi:hypothetical protein
MITGMGRRRMMLRRKVSPVRARHLDIQGQDIGLQKLDLVACQVGVSGHTDHFDVGVLLAGIDALPGAS